MYGWDKWRACTNNSCADSWSNFVFKNIKSVGTIFVLFRKTKNLKHQTIINIMQ